MTMLTQTGAPIKLESIQFADEGIIVSFLDPARQHPQVQEVTTKIINPDAVPEAVGELIEAVIDLIDAAHLVVRNPPDTIRGRMG